MHGTGEAGIVGPHEHLAPEGEFILRHPDIFGYQFSERLLETQEIMSCRRNDVRLFNDPSPVDLILMTKKTSWCLGHSGPEPFPDLNRKKCILPGHLVQEVDTSVIAMDRLNRLCEIIQIRI